LLFIRVPLITGEAGIRDSVGIVFVCCLTTLLTTLSLSALVTNGNIEEGGAYYMLSRTLGAPLGVAVGFTFYLGTTCAGAMYILGAVETFIKSYKDTPVLEYVFTGNLEIDNRYLGTVLLLIILGINLIGLKYVAKTGIVFLFIVYGGIISMYLGIFVASYRSDTYAINDKVSGLDGLSTDHLNDNWSPEYKSGNSAIFYLSIYFPSVTGIMAGANRSGDLKDASYSIPRGTLMA